MLPGLLVIIVFCVAGFFMMPSPTDQDHEPSGNYYAQGIKFSRFQGGRLMVSLQLEKIQLTGKKKGFLRLGFWKVMRFDDVVVDVYPPASGTILDRKNVLKVLMPAGEDAEPEGYDHVSGSGSIKELTGMLLGEPSRSVKGLEMHDVLWRMHENNLVAFKLTSRLADFDFKHKSIIFKGSVEVQAGRGQRLLETSTLVWNLERGVFKIPCAYKLTINGQRRRGTHLKTDLSLNKLKDV